MSKRVHEIAKERGLAPKELLAQLQAAGLKVKAVSSSVDEADALRVLGNGGAGEAAAKSQPVPPAAAERPQRAEQRPQRSEQRPPRSEQRPPRSEQRPPRSEARPQGARAEAPAAREQPSAP